MSKLRLCIILLLFCFPLLGQISPVFSFEIQRMLLPIQSVSIAGRPGNSTGVQTLCLDEYRDPPYPRKDGYKYVMPNFGMATVKVGQKTMPLQQALSRGIIEISGLGAASSLLITKHVSEAVTIDITEPTVVTEGRHDDGDELRPFLETIQKSGVDSLHVAPDWRSRGEQQSALWRNRSAHMATYLKSIGLDDLSQTKDTDILSAADYAGVAAKGALRHKNNAPIVVQLFSESPQEDIYGIAFLPNGTTSVLKTTTAADQLIQLRSENNQAPILINGPTSETPQYQAIELSLLAALAQRSLGANDEREIVVAAGGGSGGKGAGAGALFASFDDLPPNRAGKLALTTEPKELATSGRGSGNVPPRSVARRFGGRANPAPLFLAYVSRSKLAIKVKVRNWVLQFSSPSTIAGSLAATFGANFLRVCPETSRGIAKFSEHEAD